MALVQCKVQYQWTHSSLYYIAIHNLINSLTHASSHHQFLGPLLSHGTTVSPSTNFPPFGLHIK